MRVAASILAACALLTIPSNVHAGTTGGDTGGDRVRLFASTPIVSSGGGGGPVCIWQQLKRGDLTGLGGSNPDGPTLTPEESQEWATDVIDGVVHYLYVVQCPSGTSIRLVDPNTTASDLFDLITSSAEAAIPDPQHDMNPPPNIGAPVNLGLWLAVEAQSIAPITAEAGTAWITATPTIVNVVFEMGNGDTVDCEGLGVPYPDGSNDPGEGPCGYTYTQKLPDDAAYTITVTTEWSIPYTSSSGPGTLEPILSVTTYSYNIDEIQTVGTG